MPIVNEYLHEKTILFFAIFAFFMLFIIISILYNLFSKDDSDNSVIGNEDSYESDSKIARKRHTDHQNKIVTPIYKKYRPSQISYNPNENDTKSEQSPKFLKEKNISNKDCSTDINFIINPLYRLYFETKEKIIYADSLRTSAEKFDFDEILIPILWRFIKISLKNKNYQKLDHLIKDKLQKEYKASHSLFDRAKKTCPEAFNLLKVGQPLNFRNLKKCYKNAAKKYHPDRGGEKTKMQQINDAYNKIHKMIEEEKQRNLDDLKHSVDNYIKNGQEYLILRMVDLFQLYTNNIALDKSYSIIIKIINSKWHQTVKNISFRNKVDPEYFYYDFLRYALKLSGYLVLIEKEDESKKIFNFASDEMRNNFSYGNEYINKAKKCINGTKKPIIRITHKLMAENTYRLNIISKEKYEQKLKKLTQKDVYDENCKKFLNEYISKKGFKILKQEPRANKATEDLVEVPSRDDTISDLSNKQIEAYYYAFHINPNLQGVRNFLYIRLEFIIREFVYNNQNFNYETMIEELKLLKKITPKTTKEIDSIISSAIQSFTEIRYFLKQDLISRIRLLKRLDSIKYFESSRESSSIAYSKDNKYQIHISNFHFNFITLPINQLKLAINTGDHVSSRDRKIKSIKREEDSVLLNDIFKCGYPGGYINRQKNPEEFIKVTKTELKDAFDKIYQFNNKDKIRFILLDKINGLTIELVKAKKWKEALKWFEKYYELPKDYRPARESYDSKTYKKMFDKVNNRYKRCKKT